MEKENKVISFESIQKKRKNTEYILVTELSFHICKKNGTFITKCFTPPNDKITDQEIYQILKSIFSKLEKNFPLKNFHKEKSYEATFLLMYYENSKRKNDFKYICTTEGITEERLTEYVLILLDTYKKWNMIKLNDETYFMNKNSQIISFQEAKEKRMNYEEFEKVSCQYPYRGSITIEILDSDVNIQKIVLYNGGFNIDEISLYIKGILSQFIQKDITQVEIDKRILNTSTTIEIYQPFNIKEHSFSYVIKEDISDEELIQVLTCTLFQL